MTRCLIGLGSNLGASPHLFARTLDALTTAGACDAELSRIRQTRPMGINAGGVFLNAAATLEWSGSAAGLLTTLHDIEARFGRVRTVHWGPRTLDLDLLLFGSDVQQLPSLRVPHPAMWYRRFVLEPAAELAADWVHPGFQVTVGHLLERLNRSPLAFGWRCHPDLPFSLGRQITARLQAEHPEIEWVPLLADGEQSAEPRCRVLERTGNAGELFGIVEFHPADAGSVQTEPVDDGTRRRIRFRGHCVHDFEQQIRDLIRAVLG